MQCSAIHLLQMESGQLLILHFFSPIFAGMCSKN